MTSLPLGLLDLFRNIKPLAHNNYKTKQFTFASVITRPIAVTDGIGHSNITPKVKHKKDQPWQVDANRSRWAHVKNPCSDVLPI
jgi:hypothetical protein